MNKLSFNKTVTIAEFKSAENVTTIEIVKSPQSGKLFFATDNGVTGAVSGDVGAIMESPAMSIVEGDTGEPFWMLHKKQSNNVIATL